MKRIQKPPHVNIAVKNFGPIAEGTVQLRPLTVFVGPSHTGKTYFATLLYVMSRHFAGFPRFPFPRRDRPRASAPSGGKLRELKTGETRKPLTFAALPQHIREAVHSHLQDSHLLTEHLETGFDLDVVSQLRRSVDGRWRDMKVALAVREEHRPPHWQLNVAGSVAGLTVDGSISEAMPLFAEAAPSRVEDVWELMGHLNGAAGHPFYLPANRSGILQSHAFIASALTGSFTRAAFEHVTGIPTFSTGTEDFLHRLIRYRPHQAPNKGMLAIAADLERDVLAGQVIVKPSPSGYLQFLFRPCGLNEEIRLSNASSMVSELAPLVLFIRGVLRPGDRLIIEEPESHLSLAAQPEIAVALARLVKAGVDVVVTTHSGGFLEEIGNLIREGELDEILEKPYGESPVTLKAADVGVWYFHPNGIVKEIEYNRIEGVDPVEFLDAEEDLYNRSARLQNKLANWEHRQEYECESAS